MSMDFDLDEEGNSIYGEQAPEPTKKSKDKSTPPPSTKEDWWTSSRNFRIALTIACLTLVLVAQFLTSFAIEYEAGVPVIQYETNGRTLDYNLWEGVINLWSRGAYVTAFLIAICSGVGPLLKAVSWALAKYAHPLITRWLYRFGRFSFFDVWFVALIVATVNMNDQIPIFSMYLEALAGPGVYCYFAAAALGHIMNMLEDARIRRENKATERAEKKAKLAAKKAKDLERQQELEKARELERANEMELAESGRGRGRISGRPGSTSQGARWSPHQGKVTPPSGSGQSKHRSNQGSPWTDDSSPGIEDDDSWRGKGSGRMARDERRGDRVPAVKLVNLALREEEERRDEERWRESRSSASTSTSTSNSPNDRSHSGSDDCGRDLLYRRSADDKVIARCLVRSPLAGERRGGATLSHRRAGSGGSEGRREEGMRRKAEAPEPMNLQRSLDGTSDPTASYTYAGGRRPPTNGSFDESRERERNRRGEGEGGNREDRGEGAEYTPSATTFYSLEGSKGGGVYGKTPQSRGYANNGSNYHMDELSTRERRMNTLTPSMYSGANKDSLRSMADVEPNGDALYHDDRIDEEAKGDGDHAMRDMGPRKPRLPLPPIDVNRTTSHHMQLHKYAYPNRGTPHMTTTAIVSKPNLKETNEVEKNQTSPKSTIKTKIIPLLPPQNHAVIRAMIMGAEIILFIVGCTLSFLHLSIVVRDGLLRSAEDHTVISVTESLWQRATINRFLAALFTVFVIAGPIFVRFITLIIMYKAHSIREVIKEAQEEHAKAVAAAAVIEAAGAGGRRASSGAVVPTPSPLSTLSLSVFDTTPSGRSPHTVTKTAKKGTSANGYSAEDKLYELRLSLKAWRRRAYHIRRWSGMDVLMIASIVTAFELPRLLTEEESQLLKFEIGYDIGFFIMLSSCVIDTFLNEWLLEGMIGRSGEMDAMADEVIEIEVIETGTGGKGEKNDGEKGEEKVEDKMSGDVEGKRKEEVRRTGEGADDEGRIESGEGRRDQDSRRHEKRGMDRDDGRTPIENSDSRGVNRGRAGMGHGHERTASWLSWVSKGSRYRDDNEGGEWRGSRVTPPSTELARMANGRLHGSESSSSSSSHSSSNGGGTGSSSSGSGSHHKRGESTNDAEGYTKGNGAGNPKWDEARSYEEGGHSAPYSPKWDLQSSNSGSRHGSRNNWSKRSDDTEQPCGACQCRSTRNPSQTRDALDRSDVEAGEDTTTPLSDIHRDYRRQRGGDHYTPSRHHALFEDQRYESRPPVPARPSSTPHALPSGSRFESTSGSPHQSAHNHIYSRGVEEENELQCQSSFKMPEYSMSRVTGPFDAVGIGNGGRDMHGDHYVPPRGGGGSSEAMMSGGEKGGRQGLKLVEEDDGPYRDGSGGGDIKEEEGRSHLGSESPSEENNGVKWHLVESEDEGRNGIGKGRDEGERDKELEGSSYVSGSEARWNNGNNMAHHEDNGNRGSKETIPRRDVEANPSPPPVPPRRKLDERNRGANSGSSPSSEGHVTPSNSKPKGTSSPAKQPSEDQEGDLGASANETTTPKGFHILRLSGLWQDPSDNEGK